MEEAARPSLRSTPGRAAIIIVCALALFGPMRPSPDTDTWWHLATGDLIIEQGSLPGSDPFSWTAAERPWVLQAWGSDVIFAGVHAVAGAPGLIVLQGILIGAAMVLMVGVLRRFSVNDLVVAAVLFGTVIASSLVWTVRPHLFTVLFFASFLRILSASPGTATWWLVPLTALWANLHGAFVVGLAAVGIVALARSVAREGHELWRVLAASIVAGCFNPEGPALYLHPFRVMAASSDVLEWQPPGLRGPAAMTFAVMVMGSLAVLAWRKRKPAPEWLALAVVLALAGFAAIRNVPLGAMAVAPCLAFALDGWLPRPGSERSAGERRTLGAATALLVIGLAVLAVTNLWGVSDARLLEAGRFPAAAVQELKELPPGRLANPYNWGAYLIYKAPGFPVSFDGRNDMYGRVLLERQLLLEELRPGWQEFLEEGDVRYVLWKRTEPLAEALRLDEGWRLLHEDRLAVLFERV